MKVRIIEEEDELTHCEKSCYYYLTQMNSPKNYRICVQRCELNQAEIRRRMKWQLRKRRQ